MMFENGEIYEGNWENDKRYGLGKLIYNFEEFQEIFEGNWVNDLKKGFGKMINGDGEIYEGNWDDDKKNGFGKEVNLYGDIYEGNWKNNSMYGLGKMIYSDGDIYEGNWDSVELINNLNCIVSQIDKNGFGKMIYADGYIYEGNWENGKINGFGKFTFKDGVWYEGNWNKGKKNGFGKYTWESGQIYEGNWKKNKITGFGKICYPNGEIFVGEFIDGIKQVNKNKDEKDKNQNGEKLIEKPKKYYLFFDTETTGLPRNWKAPLKDFNNWPRLLQLAYVLYDEEENEIDAQDFIIYPDNFSIPNDASKLHGITTEIAKTSGLPIKLILEKFTNIVEK